MTTFSTQGAAATVGLFAAPLVPTIASAFFGAAISEDILSAFYGYSLLYVLALVLGGFLGLPLFYLLGALRLVNVWTCVLAGFVAGALSALLIILLAGVGTNAVLIYGCQGAGGAALFWVFWKLGPDPSAAFAKVWTREFAGSR